MCGRYAVFTEEENEEFREIVNEINERYKEEAVKMKTGEIFPTDTVPVITADTESNRTVRLFKWGFPHFKQNSGVIINARSETLEEKPTFRKILHTNRCLIPASGFYEWKTVEGKKEKYLITTANRNFFYMAGLYNSYKDKNGNPFTGFVIITSNSNEEMSNIHNRMPAILDAAEADSWLFNDFEKENSLLQPYQKALEFVKVS